MNISSNLLTGRTLSLEVPWGSCLEVAGVCYLATYLNCVRGCRCVLPSDIPELCQSGIGAQSFSVFQQRRRTNNYLESYHSKLLHIMHHPHPNIWNFTASAG